MQYSHRDGAIQLVTGVRYVDETEHFPDQQVALAGMRRVMSKFMAREYVTVRGEERDAKTLWRETSIGPMLVKSMIAPQFMAFSGVTCEELVVLLER